MVENREDISFEEYQPDIDRIEEEVEIPDSDQDDRKTLQRIAPDTLANKIDFKGFDLNC